MSAKMVPFKLIGDVLTFSEKMGLWYYENTTILVSKGLSGKKNTLKLVKGYKHF